MIKKIIILIVFLATVFLINNAYKRSSLNFENNQIKLKMREKSVVFEYNLLDSKDVTFSNVHIVQKKLLSLTGSIAYFEVATTEALYEFNQQTEDVVKIIFEAKKTDTLCSINGVRAMQVILKNSEVLNMFIDDNDMKELKIFYGFSTDIFLKTVERLQGLEVNTLYKGRVHQLLHPMSKWNVEHNDIDGVISSIDH